MNTDKNNNNNKNKENIIKKLFSKKIFFFFNKQLDKEKYYLILIKDNGKVELFENVEPGEFKIVEGKNSKLIYLSQEKLLNFGDYKVWIAYENCFTPYPEIPVYSADLIKRIVSRISMNYRDFEESEFLDAQTKKLIIFAAIGFGLLFFAYNTGILQNMFPSLFKQQVEQTVNQTINNTIKNFTLTEINNTFI